MGQQTRDKMAGSGDPVAGKEGHVSSFALYQCLNCTNSFMTTNGEAWIGCNSETEDWDSDGIYCGQFGNWQPVMYIATFSASPQHLYLLYTLLLL